MTEKAVILMRDNRETPWTDETIRELQRQATKDTLSGLLNRATVEQSIKQRLQAMGPEDSCALFIVDLDHFKQVNDTLGHLEGDRLLWKVAQTLQLQSGPDALQGRSGGDEFVVFLPGTAPSRAGDCARQICEAVSLLTLPENAPRSVSCSIGAAFAPEDGRDYQSLFRVADRRAYQAKRLGKNRYLLEG